MNIDPTQFDLAIIRGVLVTIVVFLITRIYNNYLPKKSFLYKIWHKEEKHRNFLTKYFWLVGLLVFLINVLILIVIS
ncbi:hypothetical protein HON36_00545 [Candidatus Parcubacteria bacterium]|jgi:uncharacterized BrkB/YihY/UPF0761 family membrane protein|nr:hypothetical protein [Candidatus Parcubacteria bacterium]